MEIYLVTFINRANPHEYVSFGLNKHHEATNFLMDMIDYASTNDTDLYEQLLLKSLIDPYAFEKVSSTHRLAEYFSLRQKSLPFKYKYDNNCGGCQSVHWPAGLVIRLKSVGAVVIRDHKIVYM